MLTVRQKMKVAGVTLAEVARDCNIGVSDTCRLLNDELVMNVKVAALDLVGKKKKELEQLEAYE